MDLPRVPHVPDDLAGPAPADAVLSERTWAALADALPSEPWFRELTRADPPRAQLFLYEAAMRDPSLRTAIAQAIREAWHRGSERVAKALAPTPDAMRAMASPPPVMRRTPPRLAERFIIANARAGQPYRAPLVSSETGRLAPENVRDVQVPPHCGLTWDAIQGALVGMPAAAGDFSISFQWLGAEAWRDGRCSLLVTPDPRSLWQDLPSRTKAEDPYAKPDDDARAYPTRQGRIVAASCRGRSHAHTGAARDDDFYVGIDSRMNTGWTVMVVCDGAGSAPVSRHGSYLASQQFGESMLEQLLSEAGLHLLKDLRALQVERTQALTQAGRHVHDMFQNAARVAVRAIDDEAQKQHRPPRDYATTLLAVVVNRIEERGGVFCASLWIGDGAICLYGPDEHRLMGRPDGGEFAGQTLFLDQKTVEDRSFAGRISVTLLPATHIALMTDGVSDPLFPSEADLHAKAGWDRFFQLVGPQLEGPNPETNLLRWMKDLSEPGHHDDRTLVVWR